MADEDEGEEMEELSETEKTDLAKWFLLNSPPGEIQHVAKDVRSVLEDEKIYQAAASEAFPSYNKTHMISLEMPNRSGEVLITTFGELDDAHYLDPRTAQVVTVDHVKQVCTMVRPATAEELPSAYIEEFRSGLDAELLKYVADAYPKGTCTVYCTNGKDVEDEGSDFELVAVISSSRFSPKNFCNGNWRSVWHIKFKDGQQEMDLYGRIEVASHYFEEGNVQMNANHECRDSTMMQLISGLSPEDCPIQLTNVIRNHESEYLAALEGSYSNLPDSTFKDLRRKLPVTRTLFPWQNTLQFNLTKDLTKELGIGK